MGRPPILSPARLRQARLWAGQGMTHAEIGGRLGVSRSRISELIKQHGTLPAPGTLFEDADDTGAAGAGPSARDGQDTPGQRDGTGRDGPGAAATAPGATAMAPEPTASQWRWHRRGQGSGEAAMTGPVPRRREARPGRWREGSSPGRLPAGMRARCWCTPSPTGSAPGPADRRDGRVGAGVARQRMTWASWCAPRCRSPSAR
jgi:hypothetical protein